jgi:2-methylcitrate dehydratase
LVYSVAVATVDRELGPEQYAEAKLRNPDVHSVIDRTTLQSDAALDQYWPEAAVSRVVLKTKNGQSCEATTLYPPGHHKNRVTNEQIQQKFTKLTSQVLEKEKREAIIQTVGRLENLKSVKELTALLGG